jgi:aspartate oxidase
MALLVSIMASLAETREESRGGHFRSDFPATSADALWSVKARRHSTHFVPIGKVT